LVAQAATSSEGTVLQQGADPIANLNRGLASRELLEPVVPHGGSVSKPPIARGSKPGHLLLFSHPCSFFAVHVLMHSSGVTQPRRAVMMP